MVAMEHNNQSSRSRLSELTCGCAPRHRPSGWMPAAFCPDSRKEKTPLSKLICAFLPRNFALFDGGRFRSQT